MSFRNPLDMMILHLGVASAELSDEYFVSHHEVSGQSGLDTRDMSA